MNELFVWECDDLRREIFSYLRKEPQLSCIDCKKVLIWDLGRDRGDFTFF